MKLKYYLRGIGLGIIFATIIMTVSIKVHNNYLSEEKIIEEALKLGMIMPEAETEKKDTQVQETQTDSSQIEDSQKESQMHSETEPEMGSEVSSETQISSQTQQETENDASSENQVSSETQQDQGIEIVLTQDTYKSSYGGKVVVNKSPDNPTREILMTVKNGATSEDVSEVLYQCGYIQSVEEFNQFMSKNAYTKSIRTGEKVIPAGSTYKEIARILMTKNN